MWEIQFLQLANAIVLFVSNSDPELEREKTNKHKEIWRDTRNSGAQRSHAWTCPVCPVEMPQLSRGHSVQSMWNYTQIGSGRPTCPGTCPQTVPGTLLRHTITFLYVFFAYLSFLLPMEGSFGQSIEPPQVYKGPTSQTAYFCSTNSQRNTSDPHYRSIGVPETLQNLRNRDLPFSLGANIFR